MFNFSGKNKKERTAFLTKTSTTHSNFKRRNGVILGLDTLRGRAADALYSPCLYCGAKLTVENLGLDHIVSIENGGGHGWDNLQFICKDCNRTKGSLNHSFFSAVLKLSDKHNARKALTSRLKMSNMVWGRGRK